MSLRRVGCRLHVHIEVSDTVTNHGHADTHSSSQMTRHVDQSSNSFSSSQISTVYLMLLVCIFSTRYLRALWLVRCLLRSKDAFIMVDTKILHQSITIRQSLTINSVQFQIFWATLIRQTHFTQLIPYLNHEHLPLTLSLTMATLTLTVQLKRKSTSYSLNII
jgi:hypothetical protein